MLDSGKSRFEWSGPTAKVLGEALSPLVYLIQERVTVFLHLEI